MATMIVPGVIMLLALAIGVVVYLVVSTASRGHKRLATLGGGTQTTAKPIPPAEWRGVVDRAPLITTLLQATPIWETLQLEILRAGWLLRPSELVAIVAGSSLLGAAVGLITSGRAPMSIVGLAIGAAVPWTMLKVRQSARARALNSQIPEAMDMLASALRSGFSFLRGLQLIASQMHPPVSQEFDRVVEEVQFGVSVVESLDNLIRRTKDYDLELVVAAVQTQLEIGGNLAEILDNIGDMIRERVKLAGEIAAATVEGRMSAGILLALPFGVSFMMSIINPGYMEPMFTTHLGTILLVIGGGLMGMGALVIKKLITIDI